MGISHKDMFSFFVLFLHSIKSHRLDMIRIFSHSAFRLLTSFFSYLRFSQLVKLLDGLTTHANSNIQCDYFSHKNYVNTSYLFETVLSASLQKT